MARSLEEFLTQIRLEQYTTNFALHRTNILTVNDEILQGIGIELIGHRKRILTELQALKGQLTEDDNFQPYIENHVVLDLINEDDDEPPPLPPKRSKDVDSQNPNVNLPSPESENVSRPVKPVKPPRRSVNARKNLAHSMSLPVGIKPSTDYKFLSFKQQPPVPPRSDLETSTSPTQKAPGVVVDKPKPVPAVRPNRLSVKKNVAEPKEQQTSTPTPEHLQNKIASPDEQNLLSVHTNHVEIVKTNAEATIREDTNDTLIKSSVDPEVSESGLINVIAGTDDEEDDYEPVPSLEDDEDEEERPKNTLTLSMVNDKESFLRIVGDKKGTGDRMSRFLSPGKNGYLYKRGGQRGNKSTKKRWVEFDGFQLSYYEEKGGECKGVIPVSRMTDVELEPNAKKPTFHLLTPNRRFTFLLERDAKKGPSDEITIWVSVLMEAVLNKAGAETSAIGGKMAKPDKEGWLSKQGHNTLKDFKDRYVAIKESTLCYYKDFEDFKDDIAINKLNMALVSLKEDLDKQRLILNTHTEKNYVFEEKNLTIYLSWKAAIEKSIQYGLGDDRFLKEIQLNDSNRRCADCGNKDPIWASINFLVVVCAECIGHHRFLSSVSKARSILMDVRIWTPSLVKIFRTVGNASANLLWSHNLPVDDKIKPDANKDARRQFIIDKYEDRRYFQWSELFKLPDELGMALRKNVLTTNVLETLRLIISGADVYYVPADGEDQRTPYELARDADMDMQMELLTHYLGHLSLEEREARNDDAYCEVSLDDIGKDIEKLPKLPDLTTNYEKSSIMLIRSNKNESWKERACTLQGRKIKYARGVKPEECDVLDLTQLQGIEYGKEDPLTITLKINDRFFYFKGHTQADADSWHTAIRNKQVMGVPLECQELNDKGIPHVIEKCTTFIEMNALLVQGVYRLNGSQINIKKLIMLFNQDAPKVRLTVDENPDVHAVAGLLKQYLRELPQPLLTTKLYEQFIQNSYKTQNTEEHDAKLYKYRELLQSLPETNYLSLRHLVMHLKQVINVADRNKMKQKNIVVIFGPILLSCANTTEQSWLNAEYDVLSDLLDYDVWLFDINEGEKKAMEAMINIVIKRESEEIDKVEQPMVIDWMQVPVTIQNQEDQMKMTNKTMPGDVCLFGIQKHQLSVNGNWALFEVSKDKVYERPVHAKEPVLQLAMTVGSMSDLVVKANDIAERIAPYQSSNLGMSGFLYYAKDRGSWQKNWFVEVKTGNIKVYKKKGSSKEDDNIAIHEILLYIGVDPTKKTQMKTKFGFIIKNSEGVTRHFCSENEKEVNQFLAAILNIRYPTGIWTLLQTEVAESNESTATSTYIHTGGTSQPLREQLHSTRTSLKKHVLKK